MFYIGIFWPNLRKQPRRSGRIGYVLNIYMVNRINADVEVRELE